jgi:hypothetical protein
MLNFYVRAVLDNILIDPPILRLLWSIAASIHYQDLLNLPDAELSQRIIKEISCRSSLDAEQCGNLNTYLSSKMMLIRDLAEYA